MRPAGSALSPCGWFTFPLDDDMEQINCYGFFAAGLHLQNCFISAFTPLRNWIQAPILAKQILDGILRGDGTYRFDESKEAAEALIPVLDQIIAAHAANPDGQLDQEQVNKFNGALYVFTQALQLELGRAPIFYVTPKGVYDTRRLINNADAIFAGYEDRLPSETLRDAREAGRCFAFSLHTAAGFHIARATEAVIKRYMAAHGCPDPKESQRNWGAYTRALTEKNANKTIVHHIDQIRELHRNPITHPEVTLTQSEANSLYSMCQSLIQAMVADMEQKKAVPDPALATLVATADSKVIGA
jgi:hypothetical protein